MILAACTAWGALIVVGALIVIGLFYTRRRAALILLGVVALGALIALLGYYLYFFHDTITDLISAFIWRTSTSSLEPGAVAFTWGEYGVRLLVRLITLYTPTVFALALIGVWFALRGRGLLRGVVIALLAAGFGYMLLLRNASYIHDYYLMYTAPALALLAGAAVTLRSRRAAWWLRPLIAGLVLCTLPATIYYLRELYTGSEDTLGIEFAQVIQAGTAPADLIMSNLPSVGFAVEFYADRAVQWDTSPAEAALRAENFSGATYYLHCDNYSVLPEDAVPLAEVEITPNCRLTRLRGRVRQYERVNQSRDKPRRRRCRSGRGWRKSGRPRRRRT